MFRSPSLPLHEDEDLSSIDPLAMSTNDENCIPGSRATSPVKYATSPVKRPANVTTMTMSTPPRSRRKSDILVNSPSRTVTEHMLSPWKIRVTVEAEPDADCAADGRTTTKTTKIPLREASSPTNNPSPKRKGRTSQTSPTKTKRAGTPVRGRSGSRSRRPSVTDLDIVVLGDDGDNNDWTKRKSPKKRQTAKKRTPSTVRQEEAETRDSPSADASALSLPKKRRTSTPAEFEIREDTDAEDGPSDVPAGVTEDSPELRTIDLNKVSVRPRSTLSRQKAPPLLDHENVVDNLASSTGHHGSVANRQVSDTSAGSYPTPEPSSGDTDSQEVHEDLTDDHNGYDTILDSEGFTMIDLESITSAKNLLGSPAEDSIHPRPTSKLESPAIWAETRATQQAYLIQQAKSPEPQLYKSRLSAIPSYLTLADGESEISSNVPSSPPVAIQSSGLPIPSSHIILGRQTTPRLVSSPKIPSPPRQPTSGTRRHNQTPPSLARVVRAGITLQGLFSHPPSEGANLAEKQRPGTPQQRLDELFGGFDSGIRRELRAGLRFGEELAKRQRLSPKTQTLQSRSHNLAEVLPRTQTEVWPGETAVQHTPQQTTNMADKRRASSVKVDFNESKKQKSSPPENLELSAPVSSDASVKPLSVPKSHIGRERQWQVEREAVSRQIENASASKVIVIDDNEDEEEAEVNKSLGSNEVGHDGDDIWLSEAAAFNGIRLGAKSASTKMSSANTHRPLHSMERDARHEIPQRGCASNPDEDAQEADTFVTDDLSGILWQESKHKIKFGARQIEREKRQLSSSSDLIRAASPSVNEQDEHSTIHEPSRDDNESTTDSQQETKSESEVDEQFQPEHKSNASQVYENEVARQEDESGRSDSISDDDPSSPVLPLQPMKIPVNFNDSSLYDAAPQLTRSSSTNPTSSRPCTPRSALKGGRASSGLPDDADATPPRKVIFSEARFLNEDGVEETTGIKSVSLTPTSVMTEPPIPARPISEIETETQSEHILEQKGKWLGWLRGGSKPPHRTSSSLPAGNVRALPTRTSTSGTKPTTTPTRRIPSYLLPPSYPSDPTRDSSNPLSTSGAFTNSHFRTLHIIYRKSQRPRFHAPKLAECRPDLLECLGMVIKFDESKSGMGMFEWRVDETGVMVVERFRREVEWGYTSQNLAGQEGGKGAGEVEWGWTAKELCWFLGRIVVGEVVRAEERNVETER